MLDYKYFGITHITKCCLVVLYNNVLVVIPNLIVFGAGLFVFNERKFTSFTPLKIEGVIAMFVMKTSQEIKAVLNTPN